MIPAGSITSANTNGDLQWVVTDSQGYILGLPPMPGVVNFDNPGAGTCLIWRLASEGTITGVEMGLNANDIQGCFSLSNPIEVIRNNASGCNANGGELFGGPFVFNSVGDGVPDMIPAGSITVANTNGTNNGWIVTDDQGNILGLPPMPGVVDFDVAGNGVCFIYYIGYENGLTGLAAGNNISGLAGCFDLSNSISVTRSGLVVDGGTLAGGPFTFCVDGNPDMVSGITLTGNSGSNSQWIVTDDQGNILGLPPMPGVVDFDAAGPGVCFIYHLSYENGLTGLAAGNNISGFGGNFDLSNSISVTRNEVIAGTVSGGPFEFCVGDGIADNVPAGSVTVSGNVGPSEQWIVTDNLGNILGLPPSPEAVNFDDAGPGTCLIWHLVFNGAVTGLEMGLNAANIGGCHAISNPITVIRNSAEGGTLAGGPFEFCVGDGFADNIPAGAITLSGNSGANSQWVVTDDQGSILGLPPSFEAVDFDGAGLGVCQVWHLSYSGVISGLIVGQDIANFGGCTSLSNPITVNRINCAVSGGILTGGPFDFCVDGTPDFVSGITLNGTTGTNNQWVVTDDQGNILGLPPMPGVVDFDAAGAGICYIYNVSFETGLTGLTVGNNLSGLVGTFGLSNFVVVNRNGAAGGTLAGGPFIFNQVGDGNPDMIPPGSITLNGNSGANSQWIVTDSQGYILGLPPMPSVVDFDNPGSGTCLIWHLSYADGLQGLAPGMNAANLSGCFDLSNSIEVIRTNASGCQANGGEIFGGPFIFDQVGDGVADTIPAGSITVTNVTADTTIWVITDNQGYILGLPPMPSAVNFDNPGAGTCLIWHLAVNNTNDNGDTLLLEGLQVGLNASDLTGCFGLSNPLEVIRTNASGCNANGGELFGGPFEFCVGDGVADNIPAGSITLANVNGTNSQWIVTDEQGNILGLPPMPSVVDFDDAGFGTCLVWHLSYEAGITGLAVGQNANNFTGCFNLSNPVEVVRNDCTTAMGGGIVINEINGNDQIEIANTGTTTVDISSYWICEFPTYRELSTLTIQCGDLVLDPGELVTIVAPFDITENEGEVGLYTTNVTGFGDPNSIIDYVEWGFAGHQRATTAAQAGIWTTGDFVPSFAANQSLEYDGSGDASTDWSADTASPCMSNLVPQPVSEFQFSVYPNPSSNSIQLMFEEEVDDLSYNIYNRDGKVMKLGNRMSRSSENISIGDLPSGMYFIKVIKDRKVHMERFMKIE